MFSTAMRDEAFGHRLPARRPVAGLAGHRREACRAQRIGVEMLVAASRAEDGGEEVLRLKLSDHDVGVGDGERAAAPVAGRDRGGRPPTPGLT
jgi:hypothetical protein